MYSEGQFIEDILSALRLVVGTGNIALHEPTFKGNEWTYVKDSIDSSIVSSIGSYVDQFESSIARYTGSKHAVAVVNGTSALHISLLLAGVEPGDEVLVPSLTFIATANAVSYCGAYPHFVDSEESNFGIDPFRLRNHLLLTTKQERGRCINLSTGNVIRALVPMHVFGHPVELNQLVELAQEFNLVLIEDAAESLGSFFHGKHTGTIGLLGVLSFNGNKIITTGGGGAILTNDDNLANRAKHITTTSKVPHEWEYRHDQVGYNYRMPNINAALGCAQLEQITSLVKAKRNLSKAYQDAFDNISGVRLVLEPNGCNSNYWLQALLFDKNHSHMRDRFLRASNEAGIMTRPVWNPLHKLLPYKDCFSMDLSVAESLGTRLVNIPSSSMLIL